MVMRSRKKRAGLREVEFEGTAETDEAHDDALSDLLDEFAQHGYSIRLQRQSDTRPKVWQHVTMMDLTPALIEDVQAQYGGGDYRALVYNGAKYVPGKLLRFSIVGRPKAVDTDDTPATGRMAELEAQLRELKEGGAAEKGIALIATMITALTPLLRPAAEAGAGGGDVVGTLNLVNTAEQKGFERGRELGKLLAGGDGGDSVAGVMRENMPAVIGLLTRQANKEGLPAAPVPVSPPPPPPGGTAAVTPAKVPAPGYEWIAAVRPFYRNIAQQAALNTDPHLIAEVSLSQMDTDLQDDIARAVKLADFTDVMLAELGSIAQQSPAHRTWVEQYLTAIVTLSSDEETALPPPPSQRGKRNASPKR